MKIYNFNYTNSKNDGAIDFRSEINTHLLKYTNRESKNFLAFISIVTYLKSFLGIDSDYIICAEGVHSGYRKTLISMGYKLKSIPGTITLESILGFGLWNNDKLRRNLFRLSNLNLSNDLKYFNEIIIKEIEKDLTSKFLVEKCRALVLSSDVGLLNRLLIKAAKNAFVPSFIFQHGSMPASFGSDFFNMSDYLIVWGNLTKKAYIKKNYLPNKIFVSGSPNSRKVVNNIRPPTLESVLVCTKPKSHSYHKGNPIDCIKYINDIELVLRDSGVTRAFLRIHPSENIELYKPFLNNFYSFHNQKYSVNRNASVVIGPQSSMIADSFYEGVAYIVYEPIDKNNKLLLGWELTPILENVSEYISIAHSKEALSSVLLEPKIPNQDFIFGIEAPILDLSFFSDIIKKIN